MKKILPPTYYICVCSQDNEGLSTKALKTNFQFQKKIKNEHTKLQNPQCNAHAEAVGGDITPKARHFSQFQVWPEKQQW